MSISDEAYENIIAQYNKAVANAVDKHTCSFARGSSTGAEAEAAALEAGIKESYHPDFLNPGSGIHDAIVQSLRASNIDARDSDIRMIENLVAPTARAMQAEGPGADERRQMGRPF